MENYEEVDNMEECIISALGESEALNAICQALDYDTKADIYDYIIRMYDLDIEEDEDEEEEEDEEEDEE